MNLRDRVDTLADGLESLIQKAEIWQLLFDECPIAIAVFTSDMRFFMVNDSFMDLTEFTKEDIINRNISLVIPPDQRKMHRAKEKEFANHPVKKINRHGLQPHIMDKRRNSIPINIDLSFITYQGNIYYVAFLKKIPHA